jgi:HTH-type transcriptional regulator/antitoxin HigA
MELRVIRDELQYAALLEQAKELALLDPIKGSPEAENLEIVALLLSKYEETRFPIKLPDPVEAIIYKLAEMGLKQKDLAEMIGSKSRASEIINRKRDLSIEMIRIIHERLRIPAEILIGYPKQQQIKSSEVDWGKFPIKEMQKRGWLDLELSEGKTGEQLIRSFFSRTNTQNSPVFFRRNLNVNVSEESRYSVCAWIARILIRARDIKRPEIRYLSGSLSDEFLRQLAKLSRIKEGPVLAREFLAMKGIILVMEPHLPKTRLDGAAILDEDGTPIIGLTLRYDRVDYFWFTLMHELIHVQRHLGRHKMAFIDDEDAEADGVNDNEAENEANIYAAEAFIPRLIWQTSEAFRTRKSDAVLKLADALMFHPAIVAGRIKKESGKFNILKEFFDDKIDRDFFFSHD